jgi:hypothetical protein
MAWSFLQWCDTLERSKQYSLYQDTRLHDLSRDTIPLRGRNGLPAFIRTLPRASVTAEKSVRGDYIYCVDPVFMRCVGNVLLLVLLPFPLYWSWEGRTTRENWERIEWQPSRDFERLWKAANRRACLVLYVGCVDQITIRPYSVGRT